MRIAEIADRDPQLLVGADEDIARLLERKAFAASGRAIVVDRRRYPLGLISITDVQRALRAHELTAGAVASS